MGIADVELVWARGRRRVAPPSEELDKLAHSVWRGAPAPFAPPNVDGDLTIRLVTDAAPIGIDVVALARAIEGWPETARSRRLVSYARKRLGARLGDG